MPNVFIREDEDPDYDIYIGQDKVVIYLDLRGKEVTYSKILIKSDGEKIYIFNSVNNSIVKIISLPTRIDSSSVTFNHKNGIFIIQGNKLN